MCKANSCFWTKFTPGFPTMGEIDLKIAVLSGKGGTGKTFVSVNLAAAAESAVYVDCDVEEPNGHLFFRPNQLAEETVAVQVPAVDPELCTGCRKCVEFCRYGALAHNGSTLMIFANICHSCGGCVLVCPEKALAERDKPIGKVQRGVSGSVQCLSGILNIGEPSGVPLIQKLLDNVEDSSESVFIDCPPGSACIVMESIKDADYCILVTEPTLYGVHNLKLVWELVKLFQKPRGVVINKVLPGENLAENFCSARDIKVLARIPFSHELGLFISQGKIAVRKDPEIRAAFLDLLAVISEEVHRETAAYS